MTVAELGFGACAIVLTSAVLGPVSAASAAPPRPRPADVTRDAVRSPRPVKAGVGLQISLKVFPEHVARGSAVEFRLRLSARHAVGALGFRLFFGDGTSRANAIPLYCRAGPGAPESASWSFGHRYAKAGIYHVVVTGFVNCTSSHAVAKATVVVS
ncbi:MAG: hypothetical protein ABSA08_06920 [Acidimicrobiales bacterium]|jgi:hypothetical protein